MSETPRPGWWQASDGNWYPPELHPSALPSPPVQPEWQPPAAAGHGQAGGGAPATVPAWGAAPATGPAWGAAPATGPAWGGTPASGVGGAPPAAPAPKSNRAPLLVAILAVVLVAGVGVFFLATSSKPAPTSKSTATSKPGTPTTPARSTGVADPPTIPSPPIPMSALDVLGGPTVADGRLLVINVTKSHQLQLSAVNPVTGTVAWQRPFSASDITQGEAFAPTTFGDLVIDLAPDGPGGAAQGDVVSVLGVDISTGDVAWKFGQPGVTSDAPGSCSAGATTLCLSWNAQIGSPLIEIDAADGLLLRGVGSVERVLGTDVYQVSDSPPVLIQIGGKGQILWQRSTASIFGPLNDLPDYGWNIEPFGALDVGSLGSKSSGDSYNVGSFTTTGFAIATGRPAWTDAGSFNCGLEIFTTPMLCRFTGAVTYARSGAASLKGVTVTIEGFAASTGKITWHQPDQDVMPFAAGTNLPFVDGTHIVISQHGGYVVVDTATGAVAPLPKGQVLWCASLPTVDVTAPVGSGVGNLRVGTDEFTGCNAAGATVAGHPANQPSIVGFTLDGKFFWPTPHGLAEAPAMTGRS
jgi:hypothetical protein